MLGKVVAVHCAHGDIIEYPLARVQMQIGDKTFTVEAGVSETLPTSVLLGTDVPGMTELLQETWLKAQVNNTTPTCPIDRALAVETRAQARR